MARILLLEDNARFARAVIRVLRGHDVRHVTTVDAAIDEVQLGEVDCALVDLNLTDEEDYSGYEVLSYILRHKPELPRAVVTGSRLKGAISRNILLRYGVSDIIIKGDVDREGYGTSDLVDTVSDLLAGSERRRRLVAIDEIAAISATSQGELARRIRVLQEFSEQLGHGLMRRDATAQRRTALGDRSEQLRRLELVSRAQCDAVPVGDLAVLVAKFEADARRIVGDA